MGNYGWAIQARWMPCRVRSDILAGAGTRARTRADVGSPLRISLGGGGADLPSYYKKHSGFLIAAAIDKYVYITLHQTFQQELIVKYSRMEHVKAIEEVQHPIVREALKLVGVADPHLEITSMADIPAGTGLGSSGSFTTALLKALHAYRKNLVHPPALAGTGRRSTGSSPPALLKALHAHRKTIVPPQGLAERACHIEIDRLGEPI